MTPITTAMPIRVATPDSSISHRTLETRRACSGESGFSSSEAGSDTGLDMTTVRQDTEKVVIAGPEAGERLDRVLAARIAELSRSRLKALILDGEVAIGTRTILDPGHRVNSGDIVTVGLPSPEDAKPAGEAIPLNVIYEDDQ